VVESARRRPQVIERRGKPIAVVIAIDQFDLHDARARWQQFLRESEEIRAEGGGILRVPKRRSRSSPFERA
jgi:hypothetical protein